MVFSDVGSGAGGRVIEVGLWCGTDAACGWVEADEGGEGGFERVVVGGRGVVIGAMASVGC